MVADISCPICKEAWTNSGDHQLVSLDCGHLFGQSCLQTWLAQPERSRCPQCNQFALQMHIRRLYMDFERLDLRELDEAISITLLWQDRAKRLAKGLQASKLNCAQLKRQLNDAEIGRMEAEEAHRSEIVHSKWLEQRTKVLSENLETSRSRIASLQVQIEDLRAQLDDATKRKIEDERKLLTVIEERDGVKEGNKILQESLLKTERKLDSVQRKNEELKDRISVAIERMAQDETKCEKAIERANLAEEQIKLQAERLQTLELKYDSLQEANKGLEFELTNFETMLKEQIHTLQWKFKSGVL